MDAAKARGPGRTRWHWRILPAYRLDAVPSSSHVGVAGTSRYSARASSACRSEVQRDKRADCSRSLNRDFSGTERRGCREFRSVIGNVVDVKHDISVAIVQPCTQIEKRVGRKDVIGDLHT